MTIGVLGGGQLGRMLALAAYRLGERVVLLDPNPEACGGHVAPLVVGRWDDPAALAELARRVDVVTFEFENVPDAALRFLADRVAVAPNPDALAIAQDRAREKAFFESLGLAVPPWRAVDSRAALGDAVASIGLPVVVKTRRFGYDGKGQHIARSDAEVEDAWLALGATPLLVEALVPFEAEGSVIGVRGRDGHVEVAPLTENVHRGGVLRWSRPASPRFDAATNALAAQAMTRALRALDYVGVLTMEFFWSQGELLANEMAPRVHNSGHAGVDAADSSQFDAHIRALCGLPLVALAPRQPCAMWNLVGRAPPREAVCAIPGAQLHLYGKRPAAGRKIGHITVTAADEVSLQARSAAVGALVAAYADS